MISLVKFDKSILENVSILDFKTQFTCKKWDVMWKGTEITVFKAAVKLEWGEDMNR